MPTVLGRDVRTRFAARLAGRLYQATITRETPGAYDPNDPAHGPAPTPTVYTCDAIAFAFDADQIDGEHIKNTDYRVTIILGSVRLQSDSSLADYVPQPGDIIAIPPPGSDTPSDAIVQGIHTRTNAAVTCHVGGLLADG